MSRVICTSQDSAEWFTARIGKVTASRMGDAMNRLTRKSKNGVAGDWGGRHNTYVHELAWGLITRVPADHYVTKAMDLGRQFEKVARAEYSYRNGDVDVELSGFALHPTLDFLGSSPDGLIGGDGGLEIKVPTFDVHVSYLEADEIPEDYQWQMYANMLCWDRDWWDFSSYCPQDDAFGPQAVALPTQFRMFQKRLFADKDKFAELEDVAATTMEQALALVATINQQHPQKGNQ